MKSAASSWVREAVLQFGASRGHNLRREAQLVEHKPFEGCHPFAHKRIGLDESRFALGTWASSNAASSAAISLPSISWQAKPKLVILSISGSDCHHSWSWGGQSCSPQ